MRQRLRRSAKISCSLAAVPPQRSRMAEPPAIDLPPAVSAPALEQARWFADQVYAHDGQLKAYLRGAFPTVHDVDDIMQESYLRLWKARLSRPIDSARSFLFQVARHTAIDVLRRRLVAPTETRPDLTDLPVVAEAPDAADALSYKEQVSLMAEALAHLPSRCRMVFVLRKFKGVSQKEIAARLAISERTVESQVTRGMKLCEAYLRKRGVTGFARNAR